MTELLIICGIVFGPWLLIGLALLRAPKGYEDSTGFHYGEPPNEPKYNSELATVMLCEGDFEGLANEVSKP